MFFAVSTKWAPMYGLALIIIGAFMVYKKINEGHEVIGAGIMMTTFYARKES